MEQLALVFNTPWLLSGPNCHQVLEYLSQEAMIHHAIDGVFALNNVHDIHLWRFIVGEDFTNNIVASFPPESVDVKLIVKYLVNDFLVYVCWLYNNYGNPCDGKTAYVTQVTSNEMETIAMVEAL